MPQQYDDWQIFGQPKTSYDDWQVFGQSKYEPPKSYWEEFKSDIGDWWDKSFPDPFETKYPDSPDYSTQDFGQKSRKIFEPFTDVPSRIARDAASMMPSGYDAKLPFGIPLPAATQFTGDFITGNLSPGALGMLGAGGVSRAAWNTIPEAATPAAAMSGYRTARNFDDVSRALSGGFAVEGAETALDPESTWGERATGGIQALLGGLGTRQGIPDLAGGPSVSGGSRGGAPSEPLGLPPYEPPSGGAPSPPPSTGQRAWGNVITIKDPTPSVVEAYRRNGYVSVPGLRSPEGYVQMVHESVADMYTNAGKPRPPVESVPPGPETPPINMRPDIPGPIGEGQVQAGQTVPIPNKNITANFLDNMRKNGYIPTTKGPTHTLFEKLLKDESGEFTPVQMFENLRRMLRRDPTPDEVQTALQRQARPTEQRGRVAPFAPVSREYQNIANRDNVIMGGVRPEMGVPVTHDPQYGGFQHHVRGNENWVTHPMLDKPQGPFATSEEAFDWSLDFQDTPAFRTYLEQYRGKTPPPDMMGSQQPPLTQEDMEQGGGMFDRPGQRFVEPTVQEVESPARGRGIFRPGPEGGILERTGPGTVSPIYDRPVPLQEGQQNLPLMGRPTEIPEPLETDIQLQNDIAGVQAANRFKRAFEAPPEQLSMEPQMKDAEIARYLENESPIPPEMVDLRPEDYEPSFERAKSDDELDQLNLLKTAAEDVGIDPRLYDDPDELRDAIYEKGEQYLQPDMAARAKMEREAATQHRNQRKALTAKLEGLLAKSPAKARPNDPPVIRALRAELDKLSNVAGKYGARALTEKELARVEQIHEKLAVYDNMQDADVPYHAKVKGGGLKITADIKRAAINLTKDYTGELSAIMVREMGQNGGDAAEKLGTDGVVRVRISDTDVTDNGEAIIEVYDNGSGLDEYGLAEKLAKLFATGKEDDPTATGGKGIGSASYLLGGKHVIIDTIAVDANDPVDEDGNVTRKADGKKYRIVSSGTPEQFLSKTGSDWEVEEVDPSTPTGTTVTVTLKDEQSTNDAIDMLRHIKTHTRNKPYKLIFDEFGIMTKGTPVAEIEPMGTQYSDGGYFTKSVEDKTIGELEFKSNKINIQLPKYDETIKNDRAEIHYLNNGMYQFSGSVTIPDEDTGFPPHVIVDIKPQVDEQHDDYPFINTRQDVKKDVRAFVDEFIKKHLKDPAVSKRKNRTQELYDSMTFVDIGSRRRTVIYDPGLRLTPGETAIFAKSPTVRALLRHYDHLIESIIQSTGRQEWAARLEGIGLVLDPGMNGVHIPNPRTGKSTILINPFLRAVHKSPEDNAFLNTITNLHEVAHIGSGGGKSVNLNPLDFYLTPEDMKDPRLVQRGIDFFASYVNQLIDHGDIGWSSSGHGMDFGQRLGEVYAAFGPRNTFKSAERLESIFTNANPSGGYSPEFQRLLYIYTESRRRDETTEDLLSGTGVKQQDTESDREGNVPGARAPDGTRASWPERIKKATGWGQGSVAADMNYGVIREAIAFFTNATTMLDFGGLTRQGLGMLLTPEYPMGAVSAFRALTYGGMQKVNAGLKAKDIMHEPINEVTGEREKSFAEKEMGLPLFTPASEGGPRSEATASKILEVGFGKDVLSTIYKHTAGYPIRATNRFHITLQNYMKITRAQRLVDQLVNISRVAGDTGRGRRTDILGSLGFTRKYSEEEALDLNPYHNKQRAREIGDFVRTAIGQAPYKVHVLPSKYTHVSFESAAKVLSGFMFSPGLFFSRARLLSPSTYVMASPFVRKQYLRALLSVAAGWFLFTSIIKMYLESQGEDGEVGDDMTSADAGKVRVGNTRMDAGGGFLQFLVTYSRLWYGGSTSSATGTYHRAGSGYQAQTNESMLERFAVNKLNPFYKFAYDLGNASEYNPFHVGDRTLQLFTSLLVQDLISLHDENPDLVPGLGPAAAIGLGTQTYEHGESQGKLIAPENDWLVTGGGVRDLMPWNWNVSDTEKRNFPWQE